MKIVHYSPNAFCSVECGRKNNGKQWTDQTRYVTCMPCLYSMDRRGMNMWREIQDVFDARQKKHRKEEPKP